MAEIDLASTLNEGSAIPKDKGMCKENDFGHIRMGEGDGLTQFTFRSSETGEPVVVEEFTMSYFDIECALAEPHITTSLPPHTPPHLTPTPSPTPNRPHSSIHTTAMALKRGCHMQ